MKSEYIGLIVGFLPPETLMVDTLSPALIIGVVVGLILCVVVVVVLISSLRTNSRIDRLICEAFRNEQQDKQNEREVSPKTLQVIHDALERGVRIAQMQGRDVLLYQSGRVFDAERDCNMTPLVIEAMYQEQTKKIISQNGN
jgi:hypothetical protein